MPGRVWWSKLPPGPANLSLSLEPLSGPGKVTSISKPHFPLKLLGTEEFP